MITSYAFRVASTLLGTLAVSCATTPRPPPELLAARATYATTTTTSAEVDPSSLVAARNALHRAEQSFARHGDKADARAFAYIAQRKAEVAETAARIVHEEHAIREAQQELDSIGVDRLRAGKREPRDTSEALVYTAGALARERLAAQEAERRDAEVVDDLHHVAHVRRSPSGSWSVTLSAPNVFDNNAVVIGRPSPQLDAVADAIVRACPKATVTVESHADSGGGDAYDALVARIRANAVAAYLANHGVPRNHLRSVGVPPRHVMVGAADYDMHGLDCRIKITVTPN